MAGERSVASTDPDDPTRYLAPGSPRSFETRREIIAVKGEPDVEFEFRTSRHGPVLSDLQILGNQAEAPREVMALAWTALRDDDLTPQAALALARAENWQAFVAALKDFHGPQQNMVYADRDGNIGFYAPARVPLRRKGNGWLPAPGSSGAYDWDGFIPYYALPLVFNPPAGYIVTANNKITPDDYPFFITRDWAAPYRAARITELIEGRKHDRESFRSIQTDQVSLMAREMLPYLLAAEPQNDASKEAQSLLFDWKGEMAGELAEPLIFSAWYRELTSLVYGDELGPMFTAAWSQRPLPDGWRMVRRYRHRPAGKLRRPLRPGAGQGDCRTFVDLWRQHFPMALGGRPCGRIWPSHIPGSGAVQLVVR